MIRLGIISMDHPHITGNHLPALRYLQDRIIVAALAYPDRDRAQPILDEFSARYYRTDDELLADDSIDAVLIMSQNCHHAVDAVRAAQAGKDIFCDKPIATSVAQACDIVTAVEANDVTFVTTFPVRFNRSIIELKRLIDSGTFGPIKALMATNHGCMYEPGGPAWVRDPEQNGGGCLIDHSVHVADIFRYLTKAEFATTYALTDRGIRTMPAEDIAVLHGEMENGAIYQIDASWSRRGQDPMWGDVTFRIVGADATATCDLYNHHRMEIYTDNGVDLKYPDYLIREHGEIFLEHLRAREQHTPSRCADHIDGLRTIELAYAAYESAQTKQPVTIKHNHR